MSFIVCIIIIILCLFSDQMLMKLANVLGCISGRSFVNPDPTYVLTYDNLMKMLAIHMRFRYVLEIILFDLGIHCSQC